MKSKKQALAKSVLALLLCVAMLVGTTFAWFTDSVVSGINTIQGGNLDVELYHSNAAVSDKKVNANTELFLDLNGEDILWEPGVVSYENLTVANEGDLALVYRMAINTANENYIVDGANRYGLSQVLKVGVVKGGITATDRKGVVESVSSWTPLGSFLQSGALLPAGNDTVGIVIYWYPSDNDNNWNLNNGKTLNEGTALNIDLGVNLTATQAEHESDFFGTDYDVIAGDEVFPAINGGTDGVIVKVGLDNRTTEEVVLTAGDVTITVPAGVLLNPGVDKLNAVVSDVNNSEANINLEANDAVRSLDVHVEGVSKDNDVPLTVNMPEALPVGLNMGNYELYHVEDGVTNEMTLVTELSAHNQFTYNPANGDVVLYMQSFSEVAMVANTVNAWEGEFDYTWYEGKSSPYSIANADQLAAFGAIVGGMKKVVSTDANGVHTYADALEQDSFSDKTVNLVNDIYIGDTTDEDGRSVVFYPVGYWNNEGTYEKSGIAIQSGFYTFEGTFDGKGHTVSDFYQNTWEMKGDHNWYAPEDQHYRDGMGLFGKVYKGTVKNLTVKDFKSDGEITTTGVIAAYADGATFENIAIVNCNPRVYNIGNGGIVGNVGWYAKEDGLETTFTNITVDNTNKISALWGSWDVPCGGIVGEFDPTSGQSAYNYPENGTISFKNCHVAAQIDVNNDVCANYQYYAYRYAGMLIGTVSENETIDGRVYPKMDKIEAEDCTVHFGDWNDYYYCELVANSLASYTHDHQMSRLEQVAKVEGTTITPLKGEAYTVPSSGRYNYVVVNKKKADGKFDHATENATCYHFVNGAVWSHETEGYEDVDENGDGVKEHVLKEDKQHLYLEFNNLVTGYGWGVTSKGVEDMNGVRILDREVADSEVKFESKVNYSAIYRMNGNTDGTIVLGNLFAAKDGVEINDSGVMVSIDKVYDNETVAGVFTANTSDWTQGTISLTGKGTVKITIQDYIYCTPTVAYLTVTDEAKPEGTTGSVGSGRNLVVNGDFEESALNNWSHDAKYTNITESLSTGDAHTGTQSVLMNFINTWHKGAYQTIDVEPNTEYRVTLWHKSAGNGSGNPYFQVVSGDSVENDALASIKLPITDTSWTQKVTTFNSGSNTQVTLGFYSWNAVGNEQYIDDIMVVPTSASFDGYITNGDFEKGDVSGWNKVNYGGWYSFTEGKISTTQQHTGQMSAEITTTQDHTGFYQTVNVKPNTDYQIAVWQQSTNASGADLGFYVVADGWDTGDRLGDKEVLVSKRMSAANTTWTNHIIAFNSGDNTQVTLCFHGPYGTGDKKTNQYVDDIEMAEAYVSFDGYVVNGDFEAGSLLGWNSYKYSWGTSWAKSEYTIYESHTGNGSVLVNTPDHYGHYQVVYVKPNTNYTVEFWYKNTDASARDAKLMVLNDYNIDSPTVIANGDIRMVDKEWTKGTITFNSGDNTQIAIATHGNWVASDTGNAEFYLDDITVTEN